MLATNDALRAHSQFNKIEASQPRKLQSDSSPTQELPISLSDELNRLNHLIYRLQTRRTTLIQQANAQHSAIFRLPSEILAEIFVYTVDKSSVCSFNTTVRPRHIFTPVPLATRWIWELNFPPVQMLSTYYYNMKAMTLDLFIDCCYGHFALDDRRDHLTHEIAFNTIFIENPDKLRVLGLRMWPEEWLPRLEQIQEAIMLSQLEV